MRKILSLIAVAAVAACSDTPVQPTSPATGDHITASTDAASWTDTSSSVDLAADGGDSTETSAPTATDSAAASPTPASTAPASSLQPLSCPSGSEVRSARGVIGPEGGTIGVRGHELKLPAGAVSEPTEFEIVVPVSDYMQIEVHAVGHDRYLFQVPASITISFQRCASLPASPLTGAYVDRSNRIVENMGGAVDRANKRLAFPTGHLSGYIIAY